MLSHPITELLTRAAIAESVESYRSLGNLKIIEKILNHILRIYIIVYYINGDNSNYVLLSIEFCPIFLQTNLNSLTEG